MASSREDLMVEILRVRVWKGRCFKEGLNPILSKIANGVCLLAPGSNITFGHQIFSVWNYSITYQWYGMVWYTLFKSQKHAHTSPNNTQLVSMEGVFVQI